MLLLQLLSSRFSQYSFNDLINKVFFDNKTFWQVTGLGLLITVPLILSSIHEDDNSGSLIDPFDGKGKDCVSGLSNLGNTCFVNSILQALASSKNFVLYLHRSSVLWERPSDDLPFTMALKRILYFIRYKPSDSGDNNPSAENAAHCNSASVSTYFSTFVGSIRTLLGRTAIRPTKLFSLLVQGSNGSFAGRQQQDAHECLQLIISILESELEEEETNKETSNTAIAHPFVGQIATQLQCLTCGQVKPVRQELYKYLSLPIPTSFQAFASQMNAHLNENDQIHGLNLGLDTDSHMKLQASGSAPSAATTTSYSEIGGDTHGTVYLTDCLRVFTQGEMLQDVECPICRTKRHMVKHTGIREYPQTLILQLSRRVYSSVHRKIYKLQNKVVFNEELRFIDPKTSHMSDMSSVQVEANETFNSQKNSILYHLIAVVVHVGTAELGHYYSYVKLNYPAASTAMGHTGDMRSHAKQDVWAFISDHEVRLCDVQEVLNAQAYLLFYEH